MRPWHFAAPGPHCGLGVAECCAEQWAEPVLAGLGRERKSKSLVLYFSFSRKIEKWKLAQKNRKSIFSLWVKKFKKMSSFFHCVYLKLLFLLLNSNQRENLILKNEYF